jgi:putative PIN family toxin of toxin-antitoxin system
VRIVLDSNVLISARLQPLGPSGLVLRAWTEEAFELVVSPQLLEELRGVLGRIRFRRWIPLDEVDAFVAGIGVDATLLDDLPFETGLTPDPDDDYLVALARSADADYLVSGDRHLLDLSDPRPPVVSPRTFLELLIDK